MNAARPENDRQLTVARPADSDVLTATARALTDTSSPAIQLERRGRRWLVGSFALCPCHLPLTLGVLGVILGGTALGAVLRDHALLAGAALAAGWAAGTWRGFRLIRLAQQRACPRPAKHPWVGRRALQRVGGFAVERVPAPHSAARPRRATRQ